VGALPLARMGVYMGIFNFFIVIPEILASLALGPEVTNLFGNDPVKVVALGGASLLVAALATGFVTDEPATAGAEVLRSETVEPREPALSAIPATEEPGL
jgi:maltose/moltooligosaccharide transporter